MGLLRRTSWFVGGVVTLGVIVFLLWHEAMTAQTNTPETLFHINNGESIATIATRLETAGLVRSRWFFLFTVWQQNLRGKTLAGDYALSGQLTAPEIAQKLSRGDVESFSVTVTFPEGWESRQMAERLTAKGLPGEAFLELVKHPLAQWRDQYPFLQTLPAGATLEGFLFPDTYSFFKNASAEDIVTKMLGNFQKRFIVASWEGVGTHKHSLFETVTLASIVEAEVKTPSDRALVADIFWRRIATGIALGSDATIQYIRGENKIQHSIEETRVESPYNTYTHKGLPPGPISNPSFEALQATLHPKSNEFFFFLNDTVTGETVFSRTFEEHIVNKQKHGL